MTRYSVEGMTCSACSAHVEKAVAKLACVKAVQVSLLSNSMTLETSDGAPHADEIVRAVREAGYDASLPNQEKSEKAAVPEQTQSGFGRFWWSLAFLLPLMYVSMQHMAGWPLPAFLSAHDYPMVNALTQLLLTTPVLLLNQHYFINGFKRLWQRSPNMDSLIAVGSGAAYLYGIVTLYRMASMPGDPHAAAALTMELYFESSAMILTLITLGKSFEERAKRKTTAEIEKLMLLTPDEVHVLREEGEQTIPTAQVAVGDVLVVRPGERIPVDGTLLAGSVSIDQSHITGESVPVDKYAGDELVAGSMNKTASFQMRATKVGEDTTLAKIIKLVQEAGDSKAPIAKLADRISGVFVPIVMGIAALTLACWLLAGQSFTFAFSCGIAVLVISCPCALGLATPVAIMVGTGVGAKHGILFRNGEVLETLHQINSVVLDKTGTLTEGNMTVQRVLPVEGVGENELLAYAAGIESGSEHPVAQAVLQYCEEQGIAAEIATEHEATAGRGIAATVNGARCLAGNAAWMRDSGIDAPQNGIDDMTTLFFTRDGQLLGMIAVADTIKPSSIEAVSELKALNVHPYLLTGDRREAALHIAKQAGIDDVLAEVMPADKANKVKQLQAEGKRVAMVGDGINDAPALKQADVGLAVGSGTDIAIETADVVLAGNRMTDVPTAIRLSRAVIRNIRENLFWAFFYNTIGIPIAAGVLYPAFGITLNPMIGAAAMSLSSVCVVSNALRLRRFKSNQKNAENRRERKPMSYSKIIHVEGMSCNHCKMSVEKALAAVAGVTQATVDLAQKQASVQMTENVPDEALRKAIADAGFEPGEIH